MPATGAVAVIQARSSSTRLPGKVLAQVGGRPALDWVVAACRAAATVDHVVLSVPDGDGALLEHGAGLGLDVVTGPEHDLITRFQTAATACGLPVIVRITADCPLLDPDIVDRCVETFLAEPVDYQEAQGYPRGLGDVDVMGADALLRIDALAADTWEREHVGPWFLNRAEDLEIRMLTAPTELHRPKLRLCVDEPADLQLVRAVLDRLGPDRPTTAAIIGLLDAEPALQDINRHVRQRS